MWLKNLKDEKLIQEIKKESFPLAFVSGKYDSFMEFYFFPEIAAYLHKKHSMPLDRKEDFVPKRICDAPWDHDSYWYAVYVNDCEKMVYVVPAGSNGGRDHIEWLIDCTSNFMDHMQHNEYFDHSSQIRKVDEALRKGYDIKFIEYEFEDSWGISDKVNSTLSNKGWTFKIIDFEDIIDALEMEVELKEDQCLIKWNDS